MARRPERSEDGAGNAPTGTLHGPGHGLRLTGRELGLQVIVFRAWIVKDIRALVKGSDATDSVGILRTSVSVPLAQDMRQ